MPLDQARRPVFTAAEQAEARATLSRMGVREHRDPTAAYLVLAFLGQALAHALLVTDSGDRAWLRRAAAVHEAWNALPSVAPPSSPPFYSEELEPGPVNTESGPPAGWVQADDGSWAPPADPDVPADVLPPATRCVTCTGAIASTSTGWRHLDVVDALAGDHDARAEVAL